MNKKLMTAALVGLPLAVSSVIAAPNNGHYRSDIKTPIAKQAMPNLKHFEKKVEKLNLTKAQNKKIDQIVQHSRYLMRGNFMQMKNFEKKLNNFAISPRFNPSQARKMAMNHADSIASMLVIQADARHQIYNVLTPKQQKKLETVQSKSKKRRGRKKA